MFIDARARVLSLPADADQATLLWTPPAIDGARGARRIATDGTAVYWTTHGPGAPSFEPGAPPAPDRIEAIDLNGEHHRVLHEDANAMHDALLVDGEDVYFTFNGGEPGLFAVPAGGGAASLRVRFTRAYDLALGGEHVYWRNSPGVYRAQLASGRIEQVAPRGQRSLERADDMLAGDGFVVLVVPDPGGPEGSPDTALLRLNVETGCIDTFSLSQKGVAAPQLRGAQVLWKGFSHNSVTRGTEAPAALWQLDLDTGVSSRIENNGVDLELLDLLAVDATSAWFGGDKELVRVRETSE